MGSNALVLEAHRGNVNAIVRAAANGECVDCANKYGVTPLMAAAFCGRADVVRVLLDRGADLHARESSFGCNALILACLSGNREVVELILERGADPNTADVSGRSPLMAAASVGTQSIVETLLAHGADCGARNKAGATASEFAYRNGYSELSEKLVDWGGRRVPGVTGDRSTRHWGEEEYRIFSERYPVHGKQRLPNN